MTGLVVLAEVWLYLGFGVSAGSLSMLWTMVAGVLMPMWIEADSRGDARIDRPYDFGLLLFLDWPLYLPWYLVRTRGPGAWAWLGAFVILGLAPLFSREALWHVA